MASVGLRFRISNIRLLLENGLGLLLGQTPSVRTSESRCRSRRAERGPRAPGASKCPTSPASMSGAPQLLASKGPLRRAASSGYGARSLGDPPLVRTPGGSPPASLAVIVTWRTRASSPPPPSNRTVDLGGGGGRLMSPSVLQLLPCLRLPRPRHSCAQRPLRGHELAARTGSLVRGHAGER